MHDPNVPRAKGKTPGGSAPLVMGPQAGPCSIHSRGGRGAVRTPKCPLTPCMTPTPHVPRGRRPLGARPLSWAPKRGHVPSIPGGEGCSTGPQVPSNPMHHPNAPRARGKTPVGSPLLVMSPQAGPCSIQFRGGMGAVRAPMCLLIPCMTPLHHVPRTRRTEGARPLSSHDIAQIASITSLPCPCPCLYRSLSWAPAVRGSEFDPRESMRHPLLAQTRGWANIACPWTMGLGSLACKSMDVR